VVVMVEVAKARCGGGGMMGATVTMTVVVTTGV